MRGIGVPHTAERLKEYNKIRDEIDRAYVRAKMCFILSALLTTCRSSTPAFACRRAGRIPHRQCRKARGIGECTTRRRRLLGRGRHRRWRFTPDYEPERPSTRSGAAQQATGTGSGHLEEVRANALKIGEGRRWCTSAGGAEMDEM